MIKSALDDPSITLGDIFRGAAPFALMMLVLLALVSISILATARLKETLMPRRFVDVGPLETGIASDPPMALPQIKYMPHAGPPNRS